MVQSSKEIGINLAFVNYLEAIDFLYGLQLFGTNLGLERARKLAALAGNPHHHLRFIHVAGTNGKGSTCAMLESIYRAAGLRTGLFTSPHLVHFGERVQVNRRNIGEEDIVRLTRDLRESLARFPADEHPTFFEVVTVMALRWFAEQKCDLVIWETGLGGRLDATNIVTPLASVITNIQLDHQAWLGDTLARIATEKAGIIKPRVPVITAVDDPAAFRILFETARRNDSAFWLITKTQADYPPVGGVSLPLPGEHQRLNAAVAAYTVRAVADAIPVSDETIVAGLQGVQWPGRLQVVGRPGGKLYLLDGAHNIGGAEALAAALKTCFTPLSRTLVLGVLGDKDCERICEILAPLAVRIILAPVKSKRTAATADLAAWCRAAHPGANVNEASSLAEALELAAIDSFVVIAGSLYLIGEAMELLQLTPAKASEERGLNDWSGTPPTR